jgi:hypothetical protein
MQTWHLSATNDGIWGKRFQLQSWHRSLAAISSDCSKADTHKLKLSDSEGPKAV